MATGKVNAAEASPQPVPLLRNRDYLILWSGQAVSTVGSQISRLSFPLLILFLTGSAAQAGLIGALNTIPYVLLALFAGALADRWNRKRVMIVCDSGRALALGSIPLVGWLGHLTLLQLYGVALLGGILNVFFDLAETASLPRVAGPDQLPTAMAQNNATNSTALLIGQPLGGLLFQLGHVVPFLADAVSYTSSVISLFLIRTDLRPERVSPPPNLWVDIREGLIWLWREPLIKFMAFLNAGLWIVYSGSYLLVIVLARHQHASPATIGLISTGMGVGGVLGSFLVSRAQTHLSFAHVVVGGLATSAVLWALYAFAPNAVALAAVAAAGSLVFTVYNVVQMSYRLALIPDQLQGRVNSIFRLIAFTGMPVGMGLTGVSLQTLGAQTTVALGVAWFVLLATVAAFSSPVRRARPIARRETV